MNTAMVRYLLGWILNLQSVFMLVPCITALIYKERSGLWFLYVAIALAVIGILCTVKRPTNKAFYAREGFLVVSLAWIILSATGALPFTLSGEIPHFIDAMFETASGFTTTGATILTDVEALSKCMLMWRSFSHWIGGMGVLVFMLAILPMAGGGQNIHILRAESPGPKVGKLVPRMKDTAKYLYVIYMAMTVIEIILLLVAGMAPFDSVTLSFGTAGTGGFGVLNSGLASYTTLQQAIITVFMILFGVNFNVYFLMVMRKPLEALKNEEVRCYIIIILTSIALITINIRNMFSSIGSAFHHAAFQVGSIMTTTGYATTDFNLWPSFSKVILVLLMFIGACAGSTGGGIKVVRILLSIKSVGKEMFKFIHPRNVRVLRLDKKKVEDETTHNINIYLLAYIMVFAVSLLIISLDNFDMTTSFTSVAATLNNIGPGLNVVGPVGNFSSFSILSKCVFIFDMLTGRLELFPMLLLFAPATWRSR